MVLTAWSPTGGIIVTLMLIIDDQSRVGDIDNILIFRATTNRHQQKVGRSLVFFQGPLSFPGR